VPGFTSDAIQLSVSQTVTGVSISDLSSFEALNNFQTAIVRAVVNSLNLAAAGGSVSTPVVTAATGRRQLGGDATTTAGDAAADVVQLWGTNVSFDSGTVRWLQGTAGGGVNAGYNVAYPVKGGASSAALSNQLQGAIAGGAVTNALRTYGFPLASANRATIAVTTAAPTAAPTLVSPGKIAAATVCSILGFCALVGGSYYLMYRCCDCHRPSNIMMMTSAPDPNALAIRPESPSYLDLDLDYDIDGRYSKALQYRGPETTV